MKLDYKVKENLTDTENYILKVIENDENIYNYSIEQLAKKCHTSRTTVLRLSKKLGFKGYSELKYFLKNTKNQKNNSIDEKIKELLKKDFKLNEFYEIIDKSKKIYIFAKDFNSILIAKYLKKLFFQIKRTCFIYDGSSEIEQILTRINKNDMLLIIELNETENTKIVKSSYIKSKNKVFLSKNKKLIEIADYILPIEYNEDNTMYLSQIFLQLDLIFRRKNEKF